MPRRSGSTTPDEAAGRIPARRRGGQELPDELQDRPEQNEGYDQAVRGGPAGTPQDPLMDVDTELTTEDSDAELPAAGAGGTSREADLAEIDDRAARAAAAEVRRRERGPR
jgi:hypothetical protein